MVALPQIRCQLHDHARQYDNYEACHNKRNGGKLHGNISQNGYGNAIIRRCRCQNRRISGRGSRTVHLRVMVTGGWGHDVYPGSGPLDGGNTLLPA